MFDPIFFEIKHCKLFSGEPGKIVHPAVYQYLSNDIPSSNPAAGHFWSSYIPTTLSMRFRQVSMISMLWIGSP